jgi:RNA polymerase sigma-70 factor (ECF subfamily)
MSPPFHSDPVAHLDDGFHALADTDARTSRVVELRFLGGFSVDEVAAILEVSPETVLRDWRLAKAWLRREMKRGSRARR